MSSLNKRYFISSFSVVICISFFFLMTSIFGFNFIMNEKTIESKPITEIPIIDIVKKSIPLPSPNPEPVPKVPDKPNTFPVEEILPDKIVSEDIVQDKIIPEKEFPVEPEPEPDQTQIESSPTEEVNEISTASDTTFEESLAESEESLVEKKDDVRLEELKKNYKSYVLKSIAAKKVYPMAARRKELAGRVKVHVVINADGSVSLLELCSPCDYDLINDAALSAVKKAAPFKKMPSEMTSLDFIFTIDFELS
ncbi:MAG: TonB family protein [Treponema sp.]|nr:TonB family protein [Treponema sp.]